MWHLLVGMQAAIGVTLLVTTGLLLVSFVRLRHVDKGFDTAGILTLDLAMPESSYANPDQWLPFFDAVLARTRILPGVRAVALTSRLPLRGEAIVNPLSYENDTRPAAAQPLANYRYVTPDYFAAIGTPLLRGRTFGNSDRERQVVVSSERAAAALWPGQDPIGRKVRTTGYRGAVNEVIGVTADSRMVDLAHDDILIVYLPYWLRGPSISSVIVRATVPPASLTSSVRQSILQINRGVAIPRIETLDDIVDASIADRRFDLSLMLAFGCVAALLAGLGVYGAVSYSVARRGREMAIRIALGARSRDIHRLVLADGLAPVGVGLVAGLVLSWIAGRAMGSLLYGVRPGDPADTAAGVIVVAVAALLACVGPARGAAGTRLRT